MAFVRPATGRSSVLAGALLLTIVACSSPPADNVGTGAAAVSKCKTDTKDTASLALAAAAVYYDPQIKVMVNTYCASCHAGQKSPSLLSFEQVAAAAAPSMAAIDAGTMPKSMSLSAAEKDTFRQWIAGGKQKAQPQTDAPPPAPAPASTAGSDDEADDKADKAKAAPAPTYLADIKKILDEHCVKCHTKDARPPALDSLKAARDAIDDTVHSIEGTTMPPGGATVSGQELAKLKAWKAGGFLQGKAPESSAKDESDAAAGCE